MALGTLVVMNVILFILVIGLQILLYVIKASNVVFILNVLLAFMLCLLSFSAFPTNFILQKILAIVMGCLAILAIIITFKNKQALLISKILLSISLLGNFYLLVF